jgi:hypothetical protein
MAKANVLQTISVNKYLDGKQILFDVNLEIKE